MVTGVLTFKPPVNLPFWRVALIKSLFNIELGFSVKGPTSGDKMGWY